MKIKVTYTIEWSTIVEIPDEESNERNYAKFVASERLNEDLEDRVKNMDDESDEDSFHLKDATPREDIPVGE